MADECDLVYHSNLHSDHVMNTFDLVESMCLHVFAAMCVLFIFVYMCFVYSWERPMGFAEEFECKSSVNPHDECIRSDDEICR